jgi:photosystem II stability/assembly factor-like uncharacterized protein
MPEEGRFVNMNILVLIFSIVASILIGFAASIAGENQWTCGGPEEARVKTISINPQNNQNIYIGTIENGIYKTTNGGIDWQHLDNGMLYPCMREIVFHPAGPDTMFAATQSGMFKSTDCGINWNLLITPGSSRNEIFDIEIHPVYHNIVYASGSGSSYKSTDGGESWVEIDIPFVAASSVNVSLQHPDTVYMTTESADSRLSVLRSENLGETWYSVHNDLDTAIWVLDMSIDPTNDNIIYVAGANYMNRGESCVAKTTDGGQHWIDISPDSLKSRYVFDIGVSPVEHNTIYICTEYDGVLKSTNGGINWSRMNNGLKMLSAARLCVDSLSGFLYLGTFYNGIYRSTNDGQLWEPISTNIKQADCIDLAISPTCADSVYVTTRSNLLYISSNGGNSWHDLILPILSTENIARCLIYDSSQSHYLYCSYYHIEGAGQGGICRSADGGSTWQKFTNGLPGNIVYNRLEISYREGSPQRLFLTSMNGLYYSDNYGEHWSRVLGGLPANDPYHYIVASRIDPSLVFVSDISGPLFRSTDCGNNWIAINKPSGSGYVHGIICDPIYSNVVYAYLYEYGAFKSLNRGDTWQSISGNLPGFPDTYNVYGMAINPYNPQNMFISSAGRGCYMTQNGGVFWDPLNNGLSLSYGIGFLSIAPNDTNRIYLGTDLNSAWAYTRVGSGINDNNPVPNAFALYPNYPNPFNSSTTIRYSIPTAGPVTLDIYDILGRKVQTLLDVKQQAGAHQVIWDANGVVSGVYFYRLKAGEKSYSRSMTVIK